MKRVYGRNPGRGGKAFSDGGVLFWPKFLKYSTHKSGSISQKDTHKSGTPKQDRNNAEKANIEGQINLIPELFIFTTHNYILEDY